MSVFALTRPSRRRLVMAGLTVVLSSVLLPLSVPVTVRGDDLDVPKPKAHDEDEKYVELLRLLADVVDQVERNYVKEVDRRELIEAAIRGMLTKLDPYSNYIPPAELDRFRRGVESEYGGIGIQVQISDDRYLEVITPIYGTPAYRAGLMAGDKVTEIKGTSTKGITIDEAVELMKGKVGSDVQIKVLHPGEKEPRAMAVRREIIRVRTVLGDHRRSDDSWEYMLDDEDGIGYIRMTAFGRRTADELEKALEQLKSQEVRGLVLDLRDNPGGLLSSAIRISDLFIPKGNIVSTDGRNSPRRSWDAHVAGTYADLPMVVLVNRYSASASEIVSACLQDHKRALVVGERTWGKGSVQNIIELDRGRSALKLTTAGYKRPSGVNIHKFPGASEKDAWGVTPDKGYVISMSREEMRKLDALRRKREALAQNGGGESGGKPKPGDKPKGDAAEPEFVDKQLDKALGYLRKQINATAGK